MAVNPTDRRPNYDISLTDGTSILNLRLANRRGDPTPAGFSLTTSPRTALRIDSGQGGWNSMEPPFSSQAFDDWSGGRGWKDAEKDKSRFYDSYRCNTIRANEIRCGPLATQGTGYNTTYTSSTGITATSSYTGNSTIHEYAVASKFTTGAAIAVRGMYLSVGVSNSPSEKITVYCEIYSHDAVNDRPDSVLAAATVNVNAIHNTVTGNYDAVIAELSFSISVSLASSTTYWIHFYAKADQSRVGEYYMPMNYYRGVSSGNRILNHWDTPSWVESYNNATISFKLQTGGYGRTIFFYYRGRTMAVTQSDDLTVPKLWINGFHGMALSNSADKSKLNTSLNLSGIDLVGKYAVIVSEQDETSGSREETNRRVIISNTQTGTNDVITVSPAWNITHTVNTEFVIQGCDSWQEITSTSGASGYLTIKNMATHLTAPVTCVLVVDKTIYFCQGESTTICRTRWVNTGGTGYWNEMLPDGTNKMTFLALVQDETGKKRVWGAKMAAATVTESDKKAWGTNLAFNATVLVCGDTSSRITNLIAAKMGGPQLPVVFKETGFGSISGTEDKKVYDTYREYPEARDWFNGRAAIQKDMYVWLALGERNERYYDGRFDDMGADRDEGLPIGRKGRVAAMVEYYSHVIAAIDGGRDGYSCILDFNGTGWHELYRGGYGRRIRSLNIQTIPDLEYPAKLWFSEEEDIYYIPLAISPAQQSNYKYFSGSQIQSSRIYAGYKEIKKYWSNIAIFSAGVAAGQTIVVEGRVDGGAWVTFGTVTTGPVKEFEIINGAAYMTGTYFEYRLTLTTNDSSKTPVIEAVRVDCVLRTPIKRVEQFTAQLVDGYTVDENGARTNLTVAAQYTQLETWQDSDLTPAPLALSFVHGLLHGKAGFVDNLSLSPMTLDVQPTERKMEAIVNFSFIEV